MNTNSDRFIDPLVAGFWRLNEWEMRPQALLAFIEQCMELGIKDMDHADIYGIHTCESIFGDALKLKPELRQHMNIITKCGIKPAWQERGRKGQANHYDTSQSHILASVDESLKNIGTDHLDVLLIHRPDYLMDADQVVEAFMKLKKSGKVFNFGVSNFSVAQVELLQSRLEEPLITNQVEMSPYNMQALDNGTLDYCQKQKINPMLWSPLAGGKLLNEESEKAVRLRRCLAQVAEELGATGIEQLVYAWLLKLPSKPSVLLGTGKIARVETAVKALNINLNEEQWYRIWQASTGHSVP